MNIIDLVLRRRPGLQSFDELMEVVDELLSEFDDEHELADVITWRPRPAPTDHSSNEWL